MTESMYIGHAPSCSLYRLINNFKSDRIWNTAQRFVNITLIRHRRLLCERTFSNVLLDEKFLSVTRVLHAGRPWHRLNPGVQTNENETGIYK
jgi:hypothetical protein